MEPENLDAPEVLETPEVAEETIETPETVDERDERIARLEKEKAELESKNKQLYERTKKKEAEKVDGLSSMDVLALSKADIAQEDIEEVLEYAKFKKIPVAEALKSQTIKTILNERNEERKTALATQTRGGARGTSKVSGEELLSKFERTGEIAVTDEAMTELFKARRARLFPKRN